MQYGLPAAFGVGSEKAPPSPTRRTTGAPRAWDRSGRRSSVAAARYCSTGAAAASRHPRGSRLPPVRRPRTARRARRRRAPRWPATSPPCSAILRSPHRRRARQPARAAAVPAARGRAPARQEPAGLLTPTAAKEAGHRARGRDASRCTSGGEPSPVHRWRRRGGQLLLLGLPVAAGLPARVAQRSYRRRISPRPRGTRPPTARPG